MSDIPISAAQEYPIVLIVDDAPSNIQVLANLLRRDYRVKVAGSGVKALEIARLPPHPDLILLDVMMPGMNGYEVCEALKASATTQDIPVIFVSSAGDEASESRGLQLGAVDYLAKPINPGIALLRVRNQLRLKRLQDGLRLFERIFEHSHEGILVTDANANTIDVNEAFCRMSGYSRAEMLGKNPRLLQSGRQGQEFYDAMWQAIGTKGHWSGEIWNRRKNGEVYPVLLSISAVNDARGRVLQYAGIFSDISIYKQHQRQLEYNAHYDALTGIPNRVLLADRLRQALAQARRDQKNLAVCYVDLDGFKPVNDTLGHDAGDQVLIEMARRISGNLRDVDTVARLGGDEFAILLVTLEQQEEFHRILERLLSAIARPVRVGGTAFTLTASIGVALFPHDSDEPDLLLRYADQAMYSAKQSGKNRYRRYDPLRDHPSPAQQEWFRRIEQGLADGEFELHFLPTIALADGRVVGAEALLRWRHPERGLLFPADFLPSLEGSELEIGVGRWVIKAALDHLAAWDALGLELGLSVNIASSHLRSPEFPQDLRDSLRGYPGIPPGRLQVEVRETASREDVFDLRNIIASCAEWGVGFALDDFGTGHSSLNHLRNLPVTTLKIDRTFVQGMLEDPADTTIVRGIISLARAFGLKTIAEGVESAEHVRALLELGCEFGQGHGLAPAMPAGEFVDWCRTGRGGNREGHSGPRLSNSS